MEGYKARAIESGATLSRIRRSVNADARDTHRDTRVRYANAARRSGIRNNYGSDRGKFERSGAAISANTPSPVSPLCSIAGHAWRLHATTRRDDAPQLALAR